MTYCSPPLTNPTPISPSALNTLPNDNVFRKRLVEKIQEDGMVRGRPIWARQAR